MKHFVWEVISSIRHSVSSPDETPRSSEKKKNSAARSIFNFLLSVSSGDQTLRLMLDILRATLIDILTSDDFDTQEDLASFREEDVFRPWSLNPNSPQQGGEGEKSTLYGPVAYTAGGGGGAPPKRGIFLRVQVYERVGKTVISVCKKPKRANRCITTVKRDAKC